MPDTNEEVLSHHRQVQHLLLDEQNPRLPEDLQGKPQRKLLEYLYETGNLTELAQSFVDNAFFKHEPSSCSRTMESSESSWRATAG